MASSIDLLLSIFIPSNGEELVVIIVDGVGIKSPAAAVKIAVTAAVMLADFGRRKE